jgi:hypothetical protein
MPAFEIEALPNKWQTLGREADILKAASRLRPALEHGRDMTTDTSTRLEDLVQQLCVEAGRLMEDTSVAAALAAPALPIEINARLARLRQAAEDIAALTAAAEVLNRRGGVVTES